MGRLALNPVTILAGRADRQAYASQIWQPFVARQPTVAAAAPQVILTVTGAGESVAPGLAVPVLPGQEVTVRSAAPAGSPARSARHDPADYGAASLSGETAENHSRFGDGGLSSFGGRFAFRQRFSIRAVLHSHCRVNSTSLHQAPAESGRLPNIIACNLGRE